MTDEPRWIARLTPVPGSSVDAVLLPPLGLDVWERHPDGIVVSATESQLREIERRKLANVERIEPVADYLARRRRNGTT